MLKFPDPIWFDELESTNLTARQMVLDGEITSYGVIAARRQTSGLGRKGRPWISDANQNLTFSVVVRLERTPEYLSTLTLCGGLAVAVGLEKFVPGCLLKWPNDVYVSNRKICGILTEHVPLETGCAVIMGIGINVNMPPEAARRIDQPATSLMIESGKAHSIHNVLEVILTQIKNVLGVWVLGGFEPLSSCWSNRNLHMGKNIRVRHIDGKQVRGMFDGIGPQGQLILRTPDDCKHEVWEGDLEVD